LTYYILKGWIRDMQTILIADDERGERDRVKSLLAQGGYEFNIVEAENGLEALELVKIHKPKIVFSDINMPLMNGFELIQNVKELNRATSVIIFSGDKDFNHAIEALRLGVTDYLPKPIDAQDFQNVMVRLTKPLKFEKMGGVCSE
jgi:two-component system response regulator YesN